MRTLSPSTLFLRGGDFTLYGLGQNMTDDGGVEGERGKTETGDIVFR